MRRWILPVATLLLAACAGAQDRYGVGPAFTVADEDLLLVHEASGLALPKRAAGYERIDLAVLRDDGSDVGAAYRGLSGFATLSIYATYAPDESIAERVVTEADYIGQQFSEAVLRNRGGFLPFPGRPDIVGETRLFEVPGEQLEAIYVFDLDGWKYTLRQTYRIRDSQSARAALTGFIDAVQWPLPPVSDDGTGSA